MATMFLINSISGNESRLSEGLRLKGSTSFVLLVMTIEFSLVCSIYFLRSLQIWLYISAILDMNEAIKSLSLISNSFLIGKSRNMLRRLL